MNSTHESFPVLVERNLDAEHSTTAQARLPTDNYIRTTKYTLLTFVPVCALAQFRRMANVYFLLIAILQSISQISPLSPWTAITPLIFVVGLSMIREGLEDINRYMSDRASNKRETDVYDSRSKIFRSTAWLHVRVGDIVRVRDKAAFPADMVLLTSHHEDGTCYVDTMNLDGETNLKRKMANSFTHELLQREPDTSIIQRDYKLAASAPSTDLYHFDGILSSKNRALNSVDTHVNADQFLLRGSRLRNTQWVLGWVVFVGHDTREMYNIKDPVYKQSNIERTMNKLIVLIFVAQTLLCIVSAIAGAEWVRKYAHDHYYIDCESYYSCDPNYTGFLQYWTYVVLLNTLIPSSLVVTVEIVKFIQALFIMWDKEMHHEVMDAVSCKKEIVGAKARTTSLNEELGQVRYIFSDKTGTLTQNKMEFRACCTLGNVYSSEERPGWLPLSHLYDASRSDPSAFDICMAMATCNLVVVETSDGGRVEYSSDSPDEVALVKGARHTSFELVERSSKQIGVLIGGQLTYWEVLLVIPFTSSRKRMTVLLRRSSTDPSANDVVTILMKGADSVVLERCVSSSPFKSDVEERVKEFASSGLRTLCIAKAETKMANITSLLKQFADAELFAPEIREEIWEKLSDQVETRMTLIGATAVEDKLQDGVGETIDRLLQANIRIWMLTGDKTETAVEIARACHLISPHMEVIKLVAQKHDDLDSCLDEQLLVCKQHCMDNTNVALVLDGTVLSMVVTVADDGNLVLHPPSKKFMELAEICRSVVVARSAPLQKAMVVDMVASTHKGAITLAVGDGANDVAMIRAASVGVGISGQEGMQAVRSSDYALHEFRDLNRLLLFHGRLAYVRLARMITYFFYKNMVFTLPLWIFGFVSAYSGQTFYDDAYITLYNVLFTLLPVFFFAIMEQDVPEIQAMANPALYRISQSDMHFNNYVISYWFALGSVHAILFTVFPWLTVPVDTRDPSGLWTLSVASFSCVVIGVTVQMVVVTRHFTIVNGIAYGISLFVYFGVAYVYNEVYPSGKPAGAIVHVVSSSPFWQLVGICVAIVVVGQIASQVLTEELLPWLADPALKFRRQNITHEEPLVYSTDQQSESKPRTPTWSCCTWNIFAHNHETSPLTQSRQSRLRPNGISSVGSRDSISMAKAKMDDSTPDIPQQV